jgi:hypothetical protein
LKLGTRKFVRCWKTGKEEASWKAMHRWEFNIKIDLKEICLVGVEIWTGLCGLG